MEFGGGEKLVEISLDSVLRKAAELEASLRGCKTRVEGTLAAQHGACAVYSQVHPSHPSHPSPPVRTGLTDQWQRLTAYIVS